MGKKVGDWYQYTGAIHIHTTESDGTKPLEDVVAIGRRAGLDFMMFADHMTLSNRERGGEGIYGNTLVVIGYEHNDVADNHHYLLFDSPAVYPAGMTAKEYVAAGAADNALGILAHPDEIRDSMEQFPPYPWIDWSADGYVGIELWNRERKLVGIASVDAHAFPIKVGPLTVEIFPYKVHFRCLRTHILLTEPMADDFDAARRQLYEALRDCRVFCSNMRWGVADEFQCFVDNGVDRITCGGTAVLTETARLIVRLPGRGLIKVVHDGCMIHEQGCEELDLPLSKEGLYRVEVWKGRRVWIFTNHIRLERE